MLLNLSRPEFGVPGAPYPNPVLPGFNPDPSVVRAGDAWYIVTSTFEYLPGLPVYRSTDFVDWQLIGHVGTSAEQLGVGEVPTALGVWAPTIRHRDGVFYVIVTIPAGRGCVVFTAEDPAGPWSEGTLLPGIEGIDPDLAWDDDGVAIVTYSGLFTSGPRRGEHLGIQQARVDLATGALLEEPRSLWSGSGSMFPEAPHLYRRGDYWYLLIAEGGTERGHGCSIARSASPYGPFEPGPDNPFLSARSTKLQTQNTGHGDFVDGPDGESLLVLLGVRTGGGTRAFSPLGRETFVTRVHWVDGWPTAERVQLTPRSSIGDDIDFDAPLDERWIGVRRLPQEIADVRDGALHITGGTDSLDDAHPAFIGRRQWSLASAASVVVDVERGRGGIAVRYDEEHHYSIRAHRDGDELVVVAQASVPSLTQQWTERLPAGELTLHLVTKPSSAAGSLQEMMTSDHVILRAEVAGEVRTIAQIDGRSLSAETAASFTGRVIGLFAEQGDVAFRRYRFRGND